ncbi:MAG: hypothetical protein AAB795_02250 [Patescibacteria group bacterium]
MDNENKYAAELQRARNEDAERQRGNEEQQEMQDASENPDWMPKNEDESKKYKISSIVGLLMIIVALIVDGISILLNIFIITVPIYWIVWICAVLGSYIWLKMSGISWSDAKGKRTMMMFGAATGIEFVPFLSALPAWTAFVIGTIINDRMEGMLENSPLAQKAVGVMAKRKDDKEREDKRKKEKNKKESEERIRQQEERLKKAEEEEIKKDQQEKEKQNETQG